MDDDESLGRGLIAEDYNVRKNNLRSPDTGRA